MDSLAAIFLALFAFSILAGAFCGAVIGGLIALRLREPPRWLVPGAGAVGAGAGALIFVAINVPDIWSPSPMVTFSVPQGYDHADVILLEDRKTGRDLVWRGYELPFMGKHATIDVPPNGVVRVRDFTPITRRRAGMRWSDGAELVVGGGGPVTSDLRASEFASWYRDAGNCLLGFPHGSVAENSAYIRARERGVQNPPC